jgi:uncharacterized membrane protein
MKTIGIGLLFFQCTFTCLALAQAAAPASPQPSDEAEEVTTVSEVPVLASSQGNSPGFFGTLGRMHPAVAHLPIGWLFFLLLIDLGAYLLDRPVFEKVGIYVLAGTVLSFIPGIVSGFLRAQELTGSAAFPPTMALHRNLIMGMASVCTLALFIRLLGHNQVRGFWKWTYLCLVTTACVLIGFAGHLGGKMVFGENFLPF